MPEDATRGWHVSPVAFCTGAFGYSGMSSSLMRRGHFNFVDMNVWG